ncbi:hypothetical protein EJ06DRAFT_373430 [Trichodelitschia bisporula]|uniref:Uncharacterized protein n=1 Tax=Trichodelitschia bisporula TaxID=703511 RepID=A0A6G1I1A6_9PEZI|nr:hypothetical protein EJ06DRAFT_373430 [Trichodelitschia bisporula]
MTALLQIARNNFWSVCAAACPASPPLTSAFGCWPVLISTDQYPPRSFSAAKQPPAQGSRQASRPTSLPRNAGLYIGDQIPAHRSLDMGLISPSPAIGL